MSTDEMVEVRIIHTLRIRVKNGLTSSENARSLLQSEQTPV